MEPVHETSKAAAMPVAPHRGPAVVVAALIGILFIGLGAMTDPRGSAERPAHQAASPAVTAPVIGARAPDFELQTVEGQKVHLHDLRGQVILINFWATWCGPCRAEMPTMQAMYDAYRTRGFVVVAVNMQEESQPVQAFLDEYGLSFPALLDPDGTVTRVYQVVNIPTSYFIDQEGIIRACYLGPMSPSVMEASLEGLLP